MKKFNIEFLNNNGNFIKTSICPEMSHYLDTLKCALLIEDYIFKSEEFSDLANFMYDESQLNKFKTFKLRRGILSIEREFENGKA